MKASFYTLGCKVNQYESQYMSEILMKAGYEIVNNHEDADIYIINSCTVTSESDRKTRQSVRRFKRNHPNALVVLTGCMPQAYPEAAKELYEADIVLSNSNNGDILDLINSYFLEHKRIVKIIPHEKGEKFQKSQISDFYERTRAVVKIEDGCDRYCSYCIIPTARGRVRSKPLDEIKKEVETLAEKGIVEIVLVGINLSAYGKGENEQIDITDAVHAACSVEKIKRVRLGSLEPDHLTEEIVAKLAKEQNLCPQFHISLQSGCDKTLKKMNRHYTADEYRTLCKELRSKFADCTLTTDVMVGFPYETQEDFEESMAFVKEIGFEKVHVFPYSPRENTLAAKWEQIEKHVKEERSRQMIEMTNEVREEFLKKQIGKTLNVLFESKHGDYFEGYTANYTPVRVKSENCLSSQTLNVEITDSDSEYCYGRII